MCINSIKTKRTFFLGVILIILIGLLLINSNKLQETLSENTLDRLEKIIVQQESQLYIKTQEKISILIGKDVFIPVTDRTFIHVTFIAAALIIILITQGIYVFLIQKEQAIALKQESFTNDFLRDSDFKKFTIEAEHLLKSRVNTDINYTITKLDIVNFQSMKDNYGQAASEKFFETLAKLFHDLTNNDFDIFTHIDAEQFLLLLHYQNIAEFEEKKASFDQKLAASFHGFLDSKITITERRYDIPVNETDIIDIFEKVNIARAIEKTSFNHE